LALGGVLAQTLNTCAAARFVTRFSWIMTSMVTRDDLSGGDSYFIVEIKSLRRMLDRVKKHPCTCYIDEILRGTNTVERIASSCAVLKWLHAQGCLCVAVSHDIELTHLLAAEYDNFHFREQVTTGGVMFDYKLKKGPSTTRNAIKLLDVMDFGAEITAAAEEMARGYDINQKW
jgi:DNA mismatch repair ATPase MutS